MEITIYTINRGAKKKSLWNPSKYLASPIHVCYRKMSAMTDELITKHSLCEFKYITANI